MNCAVHTQTQAVAYCRTCGKALCEDCKRDVMGAIYCEPCIAARLHGHAGPGVAPPPVKVPGAPRPALAAFLGFIPGVGAMYNGQFLKAFAHVLIFVMLIIITTRVGIFGVLIGFFVLYMAFEAYKTAEAHGMGLPSPDPLGLDKMFGLQESQPPAGTGMAGAPPPVPLQVEPPPPSQDNAPIGAIVLIALGVIFLLGGSLHMERLWPLFLIFIGLWTAYKRTSRQTCPCTRCRARGLMGSAVLITLGVLFFLNQNTRHGFDDTWPALLLVIGAVLLVSRSGSTAGHVQPAWPVSAGSPPAPAQWGAGTVNPPPPPSEQNDTQVKP